MRTISDAHRSLQRYISTLLPDFDVWRLRTQPQEDRPYAVVKPVQMPMLSAGSQQIVDVTQPFIVYIYPEVASNALDGQTRKLAVEEALIQAFYTSAAPLRIPMYDYDGVGEDQPGPPDPTVSATLVDGTPAGYDYMRVTLFQINSAQDANDERRWSITLTLRLAWRRHGKLISGTPVGSSSATPGTLK